MKLYHFTAAHLLVGCLKDGLTLGRVPYISGESHPLQLLEGFQWLTVNPSFTQSWCDPQYSSLSYPRNAARITAEVPKLYQKRVLKWLRFCKGNRLAISLNAYGDPENWRLYRGNVSPEWFVGYAWNPNMKEAA
jgi:hypothetical protein